MRFRSRRAGPAIAAVVVALLLSSCAGATDGGSERSDGAPSVVAAFYPLEFLADRIGGEDIELTVLTPDGTDPRALLLTPQQVDQVRRAEIILYVRGLQPAVDRVIRSSATGTVIDLLTVVPHLPAAGGLGVDRHIWLDPVNMATMAGTITAALAAGDPASGPDYRDRQARLRDHLDWLDQEWSSKTLSCASRDLLVTRQEFAYLASRYDFKQIGVPDLPTSRTPTAADLAELERKAQQRGATTIYATDKVELPVSTALQRQADVNVQVLSPILTDPDTGDYLSAMLRNLHSVREGQPC